MSRRPFRRRGDRGVTLVESAIALPILFLFIAGLVDIGMWVFNANQAANAARDGARQAILDYEFADVDGSSDFDAIVATMQAHLPQRSIDPADVWIRCLDPDNNAITCSTASLDRDRIQVNLEWGWQLVTPIAGMMNMTEGTVTGTSTMVILGRPLPGSGPPPSTTTSTTGSTTTTTTPSSSTTTSTTTTTIPCSASGLTVSSAKAKTNGQLQNDLVVSFSTNNVAACGSITVQIEAPLGGSASTSCGCGGPPNYSWTYDKNANSFWTPGTGYARVFNGASVIAVKSFTVT